jgi:hypothetical protein
MVIETRSPHLRLAALAFLIVENLCALKGEQLAVIDPRTANAT